MKRFLLIGLLALTVGFTALAGDEITWLPVTPEEMAMKTPRVDPDADAEAIFWDVRLDDKKLAEISYNHYVRIKIFTERGQKRFSKLDIPFTRGKKIEDIAARVIKPDGTIINLNAADIYERELVKTGKTKTMAKSFAVPGIEPGVIVEYQYKEVFKGAWANGVRLVFQRDVPMQKFTFHVRPQKGFGLKYNYYNMPETRFVEDPADKGFFKAVTTNVPAYKTEPHMPPEDEVIRWINLSYTSSHDPPSPWPEVNRTYYPWLSVDAKPNGLIKKKAAELTAGAATDDEKLRRIYNYVQKEIRNIDLDKKFDEDERKDLDCEHAEDVIKRGMSNTVCVELLFASLSMAAGYEVNLVFSGDRSENFFDPEKYPFPSFIHLSCIAVKVGSEWKFFNSSLPYIPYGYLAWNEEGVNSMLIAENGFLWQMTPISDQDRSPVRRTSKLKLSEDGTLEGTVKLEYQGQQAISRRRSYFDTSPAEREEGLKNEIKARISLAEVSDVLLENFDDNSKPLTYSFKIRVPDYAQKTGKRLIFQPGFFEYGSGSVFTSTVRTHDIYFAYPWSEQDLIEIQLPPGYALDSPDTPAPVADAQKICYLKISMGVNKTADKLVYDRKFYFGNEKAVLFPVTAYPALKNLFDTFYKANTHSITLKQKQ